jgi:hypothetical protein
MKTIGKIIAGFFKILFGILGIGTVGILPFLYYVGVFLIVTMFYALPADYLYSLLQIEITGITLPAIGYWAWFKIIVLIKILFGSLNFKGVTSNKKEKKKPERASTLKI